MRKTRPLQLAFLSGIMAFAWGTATLAEPPSPADCAAEADRASREIGSGLGNMGRGAARGALFGAIVGDKKSARRGAALGAVVGGVRSGAEKNSVYESVYDACMRRR